MNEWQLRELFCDVGRRVWQREYIAANDGNFSARLDEGRILATPTLLSKGFMKPEDMVVLDMTGKKLAGHRTPTSESKIHLEILRARRDVNAIIHVHPPHATAFAVLQQPIPKCVLPEVEIFLGEIPVVPYATPGVQEFADAIKPFMQDFHAFLLANHGALTFGRDLEEAYYRMEQVEQYCRILTYTQILGPLQYLPQTKVDELFAIKKRLGLPDRRFGANGDCSCEAPSPAPLDAAPASPWPGPLTPQTGGGCPCRSSGGCPSRSGGGCPCRSGGAQSDPQRELIAQIVRQTLREKGLF